MAEQKQEQTQNTEIDFEDNFEYSLEQVRRGDEGATNTLFGLKKLNNYGMKALREAFSDQLNEGDQADVLQDSYWRLVKRLRQTKPITTETPGLRGFLTFFGGIVRHAALDHVRYNKREKRDSSRIVPITQEGEQENNSDRCTALTSKLPGAHAVVCAQELMERLEGMLTKDQFAVFNLKLQNYSHGEIADKLGVSSRTVERRVRNIKDIVQSMGLDPSKDSPPNTGISR